ncbi:MAG: helix-turn-helix transcriptional regulator [Bacteroidales bacterium]|jgi:transcriptional regulator with XRE-family HTH domain|nr:helix-turn-helix transcriptional regulator [Bacteroidales bacterium]
MRINNFTKVLRAIREQNNEILNDMAVKLKVSAPYLSSIENQKRKIPSNFLKKICKVYKLSEKKIDELYMAYENVSNDITLTFSNLNSNQKYTALRFYRKFENVDNDTLKKIEKILNEKKGSHD